MRGAKSPCLGEANSPTSPLPPKLHSPEASAATSVLLHARPSACGVVVQEHFRSVGPARKAGWRLREPARLGPFNASALGSPGFSLRIGSVRPAFRECPVVVASSS